MSQELVYIINIKNYLDYITVHYLDISYNDIESIFYKMFNKLQEKKQTTFVVFKIMFSLLNRLYYLRYLC